MIISTEINFINIILKTKINILLIPLLLIIYLTNLFVNNIIFHFIILLALYYSIDLEILAQKDKKRIIDKILNILDFNYIIKKKIIYFFIINILINSLFILKYIKIIVFSICPFLFINIKKLDSKCLSYIFTVIILSIFILDLVITFCLTETICNLAIYLYKRNIKFNILLNHIIKIILNIRFDSKTKWFFSFNFLLIWLSGFIYIEENSLYNVSFLLLNTLKYYYKNDIDIYINKLDGIITRKKILEIIVDNYDIIVNKIKNNIYKIYNNPLVWIKSDRYNYNGLIEDVDKKKNNIDDFINHCKIIKDNKYIKLFSDYYFELPFFITFFVCLIKLSNYKLLILPIIFFSYIINLINPFSYVQKTLINRIEQFINLLEKNANGNLNIIKKIIKTTDKATGIQNAGIIGATTGSVIGYLASFFIVTPIIGSTTIFGTLVAILVYMVK